MRIDKARRRLTGVALFSSLEKIAPELSKIEGREGQGDTHKMR